jgi:hypothetical protein
MDKAFHFPLVISHFPFSIGHWSLVIFHRRTRCSINNQWKMENGKWEIHWSFSIAEHAARSMTDGK